MTSTQFANDVNSQTQNSDVRTSTARWLLRIYVLFSVAGLVSHLAASVITPDKKLVWAYILPAAGIGIAAWLGIRWTRRSVILAMNLFVAVSIVCVTIILVYELQTTGTTLNVLPMYYLGLFAAGLILGYKCALNYATILSVLFLAIMLFSPGSFDDMVLAIALAYASVVPTKFVEALIDEHLTNLKEINRKLAEQVAERDHAQIKLEQHNKNLALLNRASQAFSSSLSINEVLANVMNEVRQSFSAVAWSIWLVDPTGQRLLCHLVDGPRKENVTGLQLDMGEGIAGWTALHKQSVRLADGQLDKRTYKTQADGPQFDMHSILSVPMIRKNNVIGVLQILDFKTDLFTAKDQEFLELLAAPAAIAIENARLYEAAQQEIAERKRIELALRESESRYRTLIDTSPDSIVAFDRHGMIFMANPQSLKLYNARCPEDIIGKTIYEFATPEGQQRAAEDVERLRTDGILVDSEYTFVKVDGTRFLAEVRISTLRDADGKPAAFIGLTRDITQRKRAEEATLRRNRELTALNAIATILNQAHDLEQLATLALEEIFSVTGIDSGWIQLLENVDGNVSPITAGHNRCYEFSPQRLLPQDLSRSLVQSACRDGQLVLVEDVRATLPSDDGKDEQQIAFPVAVFPIKSQEHVLGVLGAIGIANCQPQPFSAADIQLLHTITRQIGTAVENIRLVKKTAEIEALRELNRLRSELIANFSHDLRTPLGIIKMSCTTLLREDVQFQEETQHELLADIEGQVDILSAIVDNILDLARIEGGYLRLHRQPTDVGKLAHDVADSLKNRLTQHQIIHEFPPAPLMADADPQHLTEVFRNLLDNAIKYSPGGGTITVSGYAENGSAVVRVRDNGLGIPADAQEKVFERFYRVENEATRRIRGVGLGLPVCRGIIEAHGGHIQVHSVPGQGSTFSFTLPVAQQETL